MATVQVVVLQDFYPSAGDVHGTLWRAGTVQLLDSALVPSYKGATGPGINDYVDDNATAVAYALANPPG